MIGCTKLLCGTATVSEAIKYQRDSQKLPPQMLQFSADERPLVVWNTTNRCNLRCQHCYLNAEDRNYAGELTSAELSFLGSLLSFFGGSEWITNAQACEVTGKSGGSVKRFMRNLTSKGVFEARGETRDRQYRLSQFDNSK